MDSMSLNREDEKQQENMVETNKAVDLSKNTVDLNKSTVDLSKDKEETGEAVNLTKEAEQQVEDGTVTTSAYVYDSKVTVNGIDMQHVHETEGNISQQMSDGLTDIMNKTDKFMNGVMNEFDSLVNDPNRFNRNNTNQQNYQTNNMNNMNNMNGQMNNMNNMNGQMNNNGNMGNTQYGQQNYSNQQNMYNNQNMITPDKMKVEPAIAALLSFVLLGLGQIINGQTAKGLVMLVVGLIANVFIGLLTCGLGLIISLPITYVIICLDAYNCTKILQAGGCLGEFEMHITK